MRILVAALSAVIFTLSSNVALAHGHGGGHVGGFSGHAVNGHISGGHFVAHGFRGRFHTGPQFSVTFGSPLFVDPYYYPPVYAPAPAYWYYCASAGAYYPQVPYCPEGWQPILSQGAPY